MFEQIILYIFLAATAIQIFFWLYFFLRLVLYKQEDLPNSDEDELPVSIVICARNEAVNLKANLHRILNQNYRSFEVIVVTHISHDESLNILSYLQYRFKQLRIVECNDSRPGKKQALKMGINEAENEIILLTDADCRPASKDWLKRMVAGIKGKTDIVLGFAPYDAYPGFLNKFIQYETCYTAIQYLSFAIAGMPYMGVGRNLAYRKSLFHKANGFDSHQDLTSGDDDLFINETASTENTKIQIEPSTFVFSKPKLTWKAYYRQKTRHLSTSKRYKLPHRILLFTLAMSHYLHYFLAVFFIIYKFSIIFALLGYALRISVVMAFSGVIFKRLQHRKLWPWVPALDAFLVLYYILFTPIILMNNYTQKWN